MLWMTMLALCASGATALVGCGSTEQETGTDNGPADGPPVVIRDIEAIRDDVIVEDDVAVVVRDGTRLSAKVFRPASEGELPRDHDA